MPRLLELVPDGLFKHSSFNLHPCQRLHILAQKGHQKDCVMSEVPSFADATAVKAVSSHTYSAHFVDEWCIGSVPHGGYVTSIFQRVAREHFKTTLSRQKQPHMITMHLEFLRRTSTGPALFTVQDSKLGRQTSTLHITLTQGDRTEVVGYITHSNIDKEEGLSFDTKWALDPPPPPANVQLLSAGTDPNWSEMRETPFAEFRKAACRVQWMLPKHGQAVPGSADEWIRLKTHGRDGRRERFDDISLGYVSDMWPQLVENHLNPAAYNPSASAADVARHRGAGSKFWFPTLLLNLDVKKALPADGVDWLFARVRTKQVRNGRYDLEVVIVDETGDVVALSHHVAFALSAQRNLASRRKADAKI
ncbi:hypothetical protein FH972_021272 [Carpinus fangiana]|uniref:Thioesterase domain-containing protein n=1 Tax=Carpinus fangiana TaxID=176857 RepID=A0A5N6KNV9_9ROSI|nr:hypothetical protein FH972_021272 [Carpinus fangiana]